MSATFGVEMWWSKWAKKDVLGSSKIAMINNLQEVLRKEGFMEEVALVAEFWKTIWKWQQKTDKPFPEMNIDNKIHRPSELYPSTEHSSHLTNF